MERIYLTRKEVTEIIREHYQKKGMDMDYIFPHTMGYWVDLSHKEEDKGDS